MTGQAEEKHREQVAYWNSDAGARWLERENETDRMLQPILDAAIAHADLHPGETVLDVGCGCGGSVVALAEKVGRAGRVLGVDISAPMVGRARTRVAGLPQADVLLADAATHDFSGLGADLVFSRFGVMFFGDPAAAFRNLRRALKPDGRIVFACWRPIDENGWMDVPLRAAYQHVPKLPRPGPEDPGPFSFADPERVKRIFASAGLPEPRFTKLDVAIDIAAGGGLEDAVRGASEIGAAAQAMREAPPERRGAALAEIRRALTPYVRDGGGVPLPGAVWLVRAKA